MKTPEEIKKGIECCVPRWKGDHFATCREDCPYRPEGSFCRGALNKDNIEYIRQLESNASQVSKALCDKENARWKSNMKDWLEEAKDVALGALGCVGLAVVLVALLAVAWAACCLLCGSLSGLAT